MKEEGEGGKREKQYNMDTKIFECENLWYTESIPMSHIKLKSKPSSF